MSQEKKLDWDRFKGLAAKLIEYQAKMTSIPIRAESWEEVIYAILIYMEHEVVWEPTSHRKGLDLLVRLGQNVFDQDTLRISAKGGKIDNGILSLSSYRLTRFGSLDGMLEFLKHNAEELDIYLICAREELTRYRRYSIFRVAPELLVPDAMLNESNWDENNQGWELKGKVGFEARIVKSMSNQLWYSIPLSYPPLEQVARIEVSKAEMGSKLLEILASLDNQS